MDAEIEKTLGRVATIVSDLAEGQLQHEKRFVRIEETMERLATRLDFFREAVFNGFTDAARRDSTTDDRVSNLESKVAALEHQE